MNFGLVEKIAFVTIGSYGIRRAMAQALAYQGWYIGNYPDLNATLIPRLCALVNTV
jgi:NAD(P)-dependent dehydrogenase (short-subunit alcohol dehydrogenase family)